MIQQNMQQQLQKKNEFGEGKASSAGRELSEPIKAVLWIRNYFFSNPDPTVQLVSDPYPDTA